MILKTVQVMDVIPTNAYFYIDEKTKHGFLIDPGAEAQKLIQIIKENEWTIEKILLTHGHFDHIGAVKELHLALDLPYYIFETGEKYLKDGNYNLSYSCHRTIELFDAKYFKDNDTIYLSDNTQHVLQVIHTPGHTPDGVIYYDKKNNLAFVGDTVFKQSIGRTDFVGGSMPDLTKSITTRICTLPDDTLLYSGHTDVTTVLEVKNWFSLFMAYPQ